MIKIEKPFKGRQCNCCHKEDDVMEYDFRSDFSNSGLCVALCRECRLKLYDVIGKNDVPLQKPLTLEEALESDYVFCEFKEFGKIEPAKLHVAQAYKNFCEDGFEVELVEFIVVERLGAEEDCEEKSDYGKTWRCWAAKPTDEERSVAEWDG